MSSKRFSGYLQASAPVGARHATLAVLVWAGLGSGVGCFGEEIPSGWECIESKGCSEGEVCLSLDGAKPRCFRVCSDASGCPAGEGCSESDPTGICLVHAPPCDDHGSCWSGFACSDIAGQCVKCANNGTDPHCRDPLPPDGLTATPGSERVELSWGSVDGATGYHVYVAYEPGVTEESTEIASLVETSYTHTYLDPTLTYYYRVSASNPWAEGPLSDEASATPILPPAPAAPRGVAARPKSAEEVVVTWEPVAGARGYRLYWDTASGEHDHVIDDVQSPYVHDGRESWATYYYNVSAYNAGGEGPMSIQVSAQPQDPDPNAPQNVAAMPGHEQVTLTWTKLDDTSSYVVYWGESQASVSTAIRDVAGPPYVHAGLTNGNTYYYRVSAVDPGGGEGPLSVLVSATPQPPAPATPSFQRVEPDSREVQLRWGSVPAAESYELFWDTAPGVTVADSSFAGLDTFVFTHTGLSNGTTYYYRLRARNGGGASGLSQEVSVTPQFDTYAQEKLTVSELTSDTSVAISGDFVVVGSPYDNDRGTAAGAAHVFERSGTGWTEVKLTASDAEPGDYFGFSVAISGDYLVVAALYDKADGTASWGSAYVFERDDTAGWQEAQKLRAIDAQDTKWFGPSVAVSGSHLAVASNPEYAEVGAVHLFERQQTGWKHEETLDASRANDRFGTSLAMSGDHVVVGAPDDDDRGQLSGAAYVYEQTDTGWTEVRLVAGDTEAHDMFGDSVAASGDYLVVGAPDRFPDTDDDTGAAYVFERTDNGWEEVKIVASDGWVGDSFGGSVAMSGDYVLVGAPGAGLAYVFQRTNGGWQQVERLTPLDAGAGHRFGWSVGISGSYLVVAAPGAQACYVY